MNLSRISVLRKIFLPILRSTAMDIKIRHPYVREIMLSLNSFKHKGYWYFRKNREKETMNLFSLLIKPNAHIVEVGGHIGFISTFFMKLAGSGGMLTVFEPGVNNLPYIKRNIQAASAIGATATLIEKAVGDRVGDATFYEEDLTGQNNSIIKNFKGFEQNAKNSFSKAKTVERTVAMTTLDITLKDHLVDFIKIDVEGFEKYVLFGAHETLDRDKPILMVEVQADEDDIFNFFKDNGWLMFSDKGISLLSPAELKENVFVLHKVAHAEVINSVFKPAFKTTKG